VTDQQVRQLVAERDRIRQMLQSVDAELSAALRIWSDEHGFLMKLSPEQALRSMEKEYA
jgi:transposase